MTFSKSSRWLMLAVLLMGFAAASFGAVRFDVVPAPTEVVNTGRSEVTGSVNLIVKGTGNVTGTSANGPAQIGLIYTNPAMQIDNTTTSGIRIFWSAGFTTAAPSIVAVENRDINGRCSGFITLNLLPGSTPAENDYIRVEGVRGRVDASLAITPGTDLYVDLQSINDPAANSFNPDRVRVAKSLDGMNIKVTSDTLLLCFPTTGKPLTGTAIPSYGIIITEGFSRAFIDADSNNATIMTSQAASTTGGAEDRVDSGGWMLGAPTNSTQFFIWMEQIPTSVSTITWPATSSTHASGAYLAKMTGETFSSSSGTAACYYSYESVNQTGASDIQIETFTIVPVVVLSGSQTAVGTVMTYVTLAPQVGAASGCAAPSATPARPRFFQMYESEDVATNNPPDDALKPYAQVIRCNCYLLFTYVSVIGGAQPWNTGIVVANTTGDTAPFGTANEAPDQLGKVTFYFYDKTAGYVGATTTAADVNSGRSFVDVVSNILPTGVTAFNGYIIAKADFQFCHGYAFIADATFYNIAQGYLASVIPDPAIKNLGGRRAPAASGDPTNIPAGESLGR